MNMKKVWREALTKKPKKKGHYSYGTFIKNKKLKYKKRLKPNKYEYDLVR
jgi:hypothetical protein